MAMDGWSNVHNEPVICVSVTNQSGSTFVTDTIDTSGIPHTADNLREIAQSAIKATEERYMCKVGSFVTDNAANMAAMRRALKFTENTDIISYGCGAHIMLNLLAKDLEIPNVHKHIVKIAKYFRSKHLPAAWYKSAGGKKIPLPLEVRWNSITDCLQEYINNWAKLLIICEEHSDEIDNDIIKLIKDDYLKKSTVEYLKRMRPIAMSLDRMQRANCTIADAVDIWNGLHDALKPHLDNKGMACLKKRMDANITADHYAAYLLHPRYQGVDLKEEDITKVYEHLAATNESFVPIVMKYQAKAAPFNSYRFITTAVNEVDPLSWWKLIPVSNAEFTSWVTQLMTAVNSSASIERVFSTFGLVHSRIRNRLGIEKAGKLVFIFRMLNSGLSFACESE